MPAAGDVEAFRKLHFGDRRGRATGVELACKLFDMLDGAAAIQLVELGEQILPRSRAFNREQAQRALEKRGITVRLNTRVDAVSPTSVNLHGPEGAFTLAHDGLIWTAGSRPRFRISLPP